MNLDLIIGLIVAVVVLSLLRSLIKKKAAIAEPTPISMQEIEILMENLEWMKERWEMAEEEKANGDIKLFPEWFYDDVTERQLRRIERIGINISDMGFSKGQASDIIGVFELAEVKNIAILKFFKIPLKNMHMNQSRARFEVEKLFQNTDNVERWKNRPATIMQKEFYRFIGMRNAPKGLTEREADNFYYDYCNKLSDEESFRLDDEWSSYQDLFEQVNDPLYAEDYDLKKVSLTLYRSMIEKLKNEGKTIVEVSDDPDKFIERIIEIKPEIQKVR